MARTVMPSNSSIEGLGRFFVVLLVAAGCGLKEKKIKARANGVRADIAGTMGHFAAEASAICAELGEAKTEIVPPLGKACSKGCRCGASEGDDSDPRAIYDCDLWQAPEWRMLNFMGMYTIDRTTNPVVYFHHQAEWRRTPQGCRLEFTVYGDLDEDGVYSTYPVVIETDPDGAEGDWPDESLLWE